MEVVRQLDGQCQLRSSELCVAVRPGGSCRNQERLNLVWQALLGWAQKLAARIDGIADVPRPEPDRYEGPEADPVEGLPTRGISPQR
jgi:hypothetical protein